MKTSHLSEKANKKISTREKYVHIENAANSKKKGLDNNNNNNCSRIFNVKKVFHRYRTKKKLFLQFKIKTYFNIQREL